MTKEFLFREPNIEVSFDPETKWIYADWIGFQTVISVKSGCEQILQAMQLKAVTKILNDNTHVQGIWSGAAEWVALDWFPRMREFGMTLFAWVYSPSIFSQLSTDKTLNHTHGGFVKTFYDVEQAKQWLSQK